MIPRYAGFAGYSGLRAAARRCVRWPNREPFVASSRACAAYRATLVAALALLGACSAPPPKPPSAVSGPKDALQMGMHFYRDDEYAAATQMFLRALDLYRSVDDGAGQVMALADLADVALVLGEPAAAKSWIAQAQQRAGRDGLRQFGPQLELLRAQALAQAGQGAEARAALEALLAQGGLDAAVRQSALLERARLAIDAGDEGGAWLERARSAVGGNDGPRVRARLMRLDAAAARRRGDAAQAQRLLEQALELYRADSYRPGIAAANEELAAVALDAKDVPGAADRYARAIQVRLWLRDRTHGAGDLDALAKLEDARGAAARAAKIKSLAAPLHGDGPVDWPALQAGFELAGS